MHRRSRLPTGLVPVKIRVLPLPWVGKSALIA
jgi:hypothetical protein